MTPITRDTPIGTRILVHGYDLRGAKLLGFLDDGWIRVHYEDGLEEDHCWKNEDVFLRDDPEPGSWEWACETVRQGTNVVSRKLGDGIVKTVAICGDDLVTMLVHGEDADECELDRDDLEATNWELAE